MNHAKFSVTCPRRVVVFETDLLALWRASLLLAFAFVSVLAPASLFLALASSIFALPAFVALVPIPFSRAPRVFVPIVVRVVLGGLVTHRELLDEVPGANFIVFDNLDQSFFERDLPIYHKLVGCFTALLLVLEDQWPGYEGVWQLRHALANEVVGEVRPVFGFEIGKPISIHVPDMAHRPSRPNKAVPVAKIFGVGG